jgi:predicted RNA polymerase sigma factor
MSIEERDLRMVVVAFEDAVTWCTSLAELADRLISSAVTNRSLGEKELQAAVEQLAETRRYLESNEDAVQRIKERAGIV